MKRFTDLRLRRARAGAQLLGAQPRRPVPDLVAYLLAVQAQDIGAAPLALWARTRRLAAAEVTAARADGSIVRTWGPRGTLHLVPREDLGWLVPLTLRPSLTRVMTRLGQEGISGEPADLARRTTRALAGQGPLTKRQLAERLAGQGVPARGQGIVYLAVLAAVHGTAVLGPDAGHTPTYVHAEDWLGAPVRSERNRDRALAELASRYLRSRGPAAPEDLAVWSGLPLGETRRAFALAGADLTEVAHGDRPLWQLGTAAAAPTRTAPLRLLPAFDEYLLSWRGRGLVLPEPYAKRVFPGGGMLKPVVVVDGVVVGTWSPGTGATQLFGAAPADALRAMTEDAGRFLAG